MIEFADVDGDGMMDMVFYYNKDVYTYYNMRQQKEIADFYQESYLCKTQEQVSAETGPIFFDYADLSLQDKE